MRGVQKAQLFATAFADPQLELWELDDEQWRKVVERPMRHAWNKLRSEPHVEQLSFRFVGVSALILAYLLEGLGTRS